jgi:putative flippase GtrA
VAYGSTGLFLASVLLWLYVDQLHISEYIAQLLVLVVTIPLNFIINKYWSFK